MKSILVITGSPRRGGNSDLMADALISGAREAGHFVAKFEAAFAKLRGCKACNKCWSKGGACVFSDGFNDLALLLAKADTLVLATPLYWFDFSAQIKAAMDKFYSFVVPACPEPLRVKDSALLICAAEKDMDVFAGAVETYRLILKFMGWNDRGIIRAPGVHDRGDVKGTDFLEQAHALGRRL